MFENILNIFKKIGKKEERKQADENSKNAAKERLHLVLMQDRANVSADFLELMKQEIIEVIKKYIDVDEGAIDVRLTNKENEDGTNGAPALYANIPIINIKNEARKVEAKEKSKEENEVEKKEDKKEKPVKKTIKDKEKLEEEKEEKSQNSKEESKDVEIEKEEKVQEETVKEENEDTKEELKSKNRLVKE